MQWVKIQEGERSEHAGRRIQGGKMADMQGVRIQWRRRQEARWDEWHRIDVGHKHNHSHTRIKGGYTPSSDRPDIALLWKSSLKSYELFFLCSVLCTSC